MRTNRNHHRYAKATAAIFILLGAATISAAPSVSMASGSAISPSCSTTVGWQGSCS
jgi:hypothetical protein